ncbi:hypothetical protein Salat_1449600 [Sesamum alatum]|uniref:Uncharacterized protein n=1 Tax=Sesamum alatum TaxID=300844 RepID=A0AAE1YB57_9LAMI|nr:hypothetical protein Salat_1449600 [Sesamum alatum]
MITRSKLVEQLRDFQIRSQHKWPALTIFSPKPFLSTWRDVAVAIFLALIFIVLLVSSYVTLYLRHYWISVVFVCLGILLPAATSLMHTWQPVARIGLLSSAGRFSLLSMGVMHACRRSAYAEH